MEKPSARNFCAAWNRELLHAYNVLKSAMQPAIALAAAIFGLARWVLARGP